LSTAARACLVAGALALATGVALGAIGAHAARSAPHPDAARLVQTAVLYQLVHGLGLVATGLALRLAGPSRLLAAAGALFALGILAFAGSLYSLAFLAVSLGALAPVGGVAFILGWIAFAAWAAKGT
jgi:uncharacterized membrane protein YgdD (TMEM256/DUF423 family)